MPKVSVVIKSYNHEKYVAESIESVLNQSFQDFDIVVTDDASTDRTVEIIRSFCDPRISLQVNERNRGISATMNQTVARATGDYIAILNSDDFMLPGRLATQVELLERNPNLSGCFGLPQVVGESGAPQPRPLYFERSPILHNTAATTWARALFFQQNFVCAPTAMFRREVLQSEPYDLRFTSLQDYEMWTRLACRGHGMGFVNQELVAFRVRDALGNASAPRPENTTRAAVEDAWILRAFLKLCDDDVQKIFGADFVEYNITGPGSTKWRLAELCLTTPARRLHAFAVEAMYQLAQTEAQCKRLAQVCGQFDVTGLLERANLVNQLNALKAAMGKPRP